MPTEPSWAQYDWLRSVYTRRSHQPDWTRFSDDEKAKALREAAEHDQVARARPRPDMMTDWSWLGILRRFEKP